ncbi:MAG: hypothetical protein ABI824_02365 [Acidobacteriota bacterium]
MDYPFGPQELEDDLQGRDEHPTHEEMQSYSERTLRSFAEIGQDEFLKFEQHASECDNCLLTLIETRIQLLNKKANRKAAT